MTASDDLPPLPKIGRLAAAMMAIDVVRVSLTQRPEPSADSTSSGGGDAELEDLVVALANLSAVLIQSLQVISKRNGGAAIDGLAFLEVIRRDQHIHEARRQMEGLDEGYPFDG